MQVLVITVRFRERRSLGQKTASGRMKQSNWAMMLP
jgi:hypothetical protein